MSDARRRYTVALVGVLAYVAMDLLVQSLPPHYSPISQAESDLAVGPYGYLMGVNFLLRGVLSLEALGAIRGSAKIYGLQPGSLRLGTLLFGVWSLGSMLLALFPTDVPPTPVSWHGALHLVIAICAFIGGGAGALALGSRMASSGRFRAQGRFAGYFGWFALATLLIELLAPFAAPAVTASYGGLTERLFLGSVLVWVGGTALLGLKTLPGADSR